MSKNSIFLMCQALQQEKHVLLRKLEVNELESGQREAELVADLAAAKAELERHHSQGRDRRRDESGQLTQLANHNQRLVEQLSEVMKQRTYLHVLCVIQMEGGGGWGGMQPSRFRCHSHTFCLNFGLPSTQAVTLEHSLRTELRSLRDEMEESSFSRNINFKQLEGIQAEVPVDMKSVATTIAADI